MNNLPCLRLFLGTLSLLPASLIANDWPNYRGPNHNGFVAASEPAEHWQLDDATVAWEGKLGVGYSAIAVANGIAYGMGHDSAGQETIHAFDASTGDVIWSKSYRAELLPNMHEGGPGATPTISEGRVFALSKDGQVLCLDAANGEVFWTANLKDSLGIEVPTWGYSNSPLIIGDRVIFGAGRVAALDKSTGKTVWVSKNTYHPGYSSVVAFEFEGSRYLAAFDGKGLSIHDPSSGAEVARHGFQTRYDMTAADPVISNDGSRLLISSMSKSELLAFDGKTLERVYETTDLKSTMSGAVLVDGFLYGVSGAQKDKRASVVCMRFDDGEVMWEQKNFGYASLIAVGDALVILTEDGDVVTAKLDSGSYQEISRKKGVLDAVNWTPPSYADGSVFVRNDAGRIVCLKL